MRKKHHQKQKALGPIEQLEFSLTGPTEIGPYFNAAGLPNGHINVGDVRLPVSLGVLLPKVAQSWRSRC